MDGDRGLAAGLRAVIALAVDVDDEVVAALGDLALHVEPAADEEGLLAVARTIRDAPVGDFLACGQGRDYRVYHHPSLILVLTQGPPEETLANSL